MLHPKDSIRIYHLCISFTLQVALLRSTIVDNKYNRNQTGSLCEGFTDSSGRLQFLDPPDIWNTSQIVPQSIFPRIILRTQCSKEIAVVSFQ